MRRIILIALLVSVTPAYAGAISGFPEYITSFETLTPQGTYVNALGTLGSPAIDVSIAFYSSYFLTYGGCYTGLGPDRADPAFLQCSTSNIDGGSCASPFEISVSSNAGSFDNYDGADATYSCPHGSFSVTRGSNGVTGSLRGLDFYTASPSQLGPYIYEGVTIDFHGPIPASATLWNFLSYSAQWTGSGSFFRYTQNAQFVYTAGYKGTFAIVPASELPEPGALALFGVGLAGILGALRWRSGRKNS